MKEDKDRWNRKYGAGDFPKSPSRIVQSFSRQALRGRALDIASGAGRNSLFLAELGYEVDALDISDAALSSLKDLPNIMPLCVDLDTFDIPRNRYNLILNIRFLQRRLFPQIIEGLVDGGMLIFEAYLLDIKPVSGKPHRREFMLRPNELIHAFLPLRILHYQETVAEDTEEGRPIASLVAVKDRNGW